MISFTYKIASNPPSPPFTKAACGSQGVRRRDLQFSWFVGDKLIM